MAVHARPGLVTATGRRHVAAGPVRLAVAIALVSAAALAYQLLLMRWLAIAHWHPFAVMIISLALLGHGASGTWLSLWLRDPADPRARSRFELRFAACAAGFALSALAALWLARLVPFNGLEMVWDPRQLLWLSILYLLLAMPFLFSASCFGLAFARHGARIPALYGADLIGAGIGALLAVALLALPVDRGLLLAASGGPLAAALVAPRWPHRLGCVLVAAAVLVLLPGRALAPQANEFKGLSKALLLPGARVVSERHGPYGWLAVVASPRVRMRHAPGLSMANTDEVPSQLGLFTDGDGLSVVTRNDGRPQSLAYLGRMTSALPYQLLSRPSVLVLGAGGGQEVLQALALGARGGCGRVQPAAGRAGARRTRRVRRRAVPRSTRAGGRRRTARVRACGHAALRPDRARQWRFVRRRRCRRAGRGRALRADHRGAARLPRPARARRHARGHALEQAATARRTQVVRHRRGGPARRRRRRSGRARGRAPQLGRQYLAGTARWLWCGRPCGVARVRRPPRLRSGPPAGAGGGRSEQLPRVRSSGPVRRRQCAVVATRRRLPARLQVRDRAGHRRPSVLRRLLPLARAAGTVAAARAGQRGAAGFRHPAAAGDVAAGGAAGGGAGAAAAAGATARALGRCNRGSRPGRGVLHCVGPGLHARRDRLAVAADPARRPSAAGGDGRTRRFPAVRRQRQPVCAAPARGRGRTVCADRGGLRRDDAAGRVRDRAGDAVAGHGVQRHPRVGCRRAGAGARRRGLAGHRATGVFDGTAVRARAGEVGAHGAGVGAVGMGIERAALRCWPRSLRCCWRWRWACARRCCARWRCTCWRRGRGAATLSTGRAGRRRATSAPCAIPARHRSPAAPRRARRAGRGGPATTAPVVRAGSRRGAASAPAADR